MSSLNDRNKYLLDEFDGVIGIDDSQLKSDNGEPWWVEAEVDGLRSEKFLANIKSDINEKMFGHHIERATKPLFGDCKLSFTVLNFASASHVDDSINEPFRLYKDNANLVPNLIETLGVDNIEQFWHIRTDEEYGHLESVKEVFNVGDPIRPRNPYSASKASQTLFLESLKKTFDFPVNFFVLANQYGKYQHPSKMIPATIKRIFNNEDVLIYGNGDNYREWTFVEDTVDVICQEMVSDNPDSIIHISNEEGLLNNIELVDCIISTIKKYEPINMNIKFIEDRLGHDFCYRLHSEVDHKFKSLFDGIDETVRYYINIWR